MRKRRLSRNELVKHILDTMPEDYNEYEKLAFVELEVAKNIAFDEQYLWGDIETKQKIYKLAKKAAQTPRSKTDKKLICITMAELFAYVAKAVGFNTKFQKIGLMQDVKKGDNEIFKNISDKIQEHVCVVVQLSNGQEIEVDIQDDLYRLQTHCRPNAFGQAIHQRGIKLLPSNLIDQTFKKVYQLKEDESFMDKYIRDLAIKLQNKTSIEAIEAFMEDARVQKQLKDVGCIEANKLFKKILGNIYGYKESRDFLGKDGKAFTDECVLSDSKGKKKYSFCIYAEDDTQKVLYVYSKKTKRMVKVTPEDIKQMKQTSMDIGLRARHSQLKQNMISFINSAQESAEIKEEQTSSISVEDIFLEHDEK